jgi:type II secretory ATPase GspE/PulE/Tfp pilus assembly ATPase PilB-like protein
MLEPYGLILISGPTGSGKTTTLYSMLNELDREKRNVVSLEDPVEYNIPGMNQSQIAPEIGYTFASGLRSILRQDPDVIMVGEIRDKETAELTIQASLTGHMVFATIHTNNAIGTVPRLVDMGIDPYLIAPTLTLSIAQRLVRIACPSSIKPIPVEGAVQMMFDKQFADLPPEFKKNLNLTGNVYELEPSPECPSGTRGRVAVFEIFDIDKEAETMILKEPTDIELWKIARRKGMLTMKEDAILKALRGEIAFQEVNSL